MIFTSYSKTTVFLLLLSGIFSYHAQADILQPFKNEEGFTLSIIGGQSDTSTSSFMSTSDNKPTLGKDNPFYSISGEWFVNSDNFQKGFLSLRTGYANWGDRTTQVCSRFNSSCTRWHKKAYSYFIGPALSSHSFLANKLKITAGFYLSDNHYETSFGNSNRQALLFSLQGQIKPLESVAIGINISTTQIEELNGDAVTLRSEAINLTVYF